MKQWQTPDTPAFNDAFTREFLDKDAETPEGFHLFRSGTGYYTILFPENYVLVEESYYRKRGVSSTEHPDTENVYMHQDGVSPKENKLIKGIKLFLKPDGNVIVDTRIRSMLRKINAPADTEVKTFKDNNKTVYCAENVDEYKEGDASTDKTFYFYGFIVHNVSKQALYFNLEHTCFDSHNRCPIDFEKEKKMALQMMKSVEFQ
ncbi:hypothetical protein [Numidum massiliense]|uniref:hypothetical protein n=1 Tax=Numidum massiliense TaxID=1522315 RepID=UPI0011CC51B7|nr:hypothetical protein [Numidum massiliense]